MKTHNLKQNGQPPVQSSGALAAAILLFFFALACSFNVGGEGKSAANSDKKTAATTKAKFEDSRPTAMKDDKATKGEANKQSEAADNGDFEAVYVEVKNEKYADVNERFRQQKIVEQIAESFNNDLSLPHDVAIKFKDCGQENAFYNPSEKSITMCYEFMESFYNAFVEMGKSEDEASDMMVGATMFFLLHELGHCLIDVYNLPATGREEDSVDQLSTYILLNENDEDMHNAAIAGAAVFRAWSMNEEASPRAYADEHSLGSQRFFNITCWMYGRDQAQYAFLVEDGILPEARAVRCPTEYKKMSSAWERLVEPYVKK
jgi:hypothetical protein